MQGDLEEEYKSINIPLALIYGEHSESFKAKSANYMKEMKPELTLIEIKDAQHHLFLDQPMAFVDAVKGILKDWS